MTDIVRRWRVQGTVQGVGFRWFVREEARALGLRGWVRNEPTGEVLVEVGGAPASVEQLARAVRQGPAASVVTGMVEEPAASSESESLPTPFAVHR